jgi:hypothetical protein
METSYFFDDDSSNGEAFERYSKGEFILSMVIPGQEQICLRLMLLLTIYLSI